MRLNVFDRINNRMAQSIMLKPKRLHLLQGTLSICFDDFPQNAWTVAGPILADHNVRATYFVSGGLCNQINGGLRQFTDNDLQEVWASAHEIGCHTYDHVSALKTPLRIFSNSISRNATFLAERLGIKRIESFAFPYNHVTLRSKFLIARQFKFARGVGNKLNDKWLDLSEMLSINLSLSSIGGGSHNSVRPIDLCKLIEQAAQGKKWLIVYTHDVSDKPSEHGTKTHDFETMILHAKQVGLDIKPIRDVIGSPMDKSPSFSSDQAWSA